MLEDILSLSGVQQLIITDIDDLKERVGKIESGFESLTSHVIPSHADGLKRLEGIVFIEISEVNKIFTELFLTYILITR